MKKPSLFVIIFLLWPAWSRGGEDSLAGLWPLGQSKAGIEADLVQSVFERPLWYAEDPGGNVISTGAIYGLKGMSQKGVDVTLELRWFDGGRTELELLAPYHFLEYSPARLWDTEATNIYSGDHLGDLELRHRLLLWSLNSGSRAFLGSLVSLVTAPTGVGPWQASHPFIATGLGTWSAGTGLVLGQKAGPVRLWQQVSASYVLGYEGSIPAGALITPEPEGVADLSLPGGKGWIKPGDELELLGGFSVCLIQNQDAAYYGGMEIKAAFSGETSLDSGNIAGSNTKSLDLYPQVKADFPPNFFIQGGARYPLVLVHLPGPAWIEPVFRVGYQF